MSRDRIVDLQRRLHEAGHIRLGRQQESNGKTRPVKLETFRFTSKDRSAVEALAALYGGTVEPWQHPGSLDRWEVISTRKEIPVVVPTAVMGFMQQYEAWGGGFATKRCDGVRDSIRDCPCDCDPENRECKITTRLSLILPEVPGIGTWRLESHGYYAAVELGGAVELLEAAAARGVAVSAILRLDERQVRRLVNNKPETRRFVVPQLDLDRSWRAFAAQPGASLTSGHAQLPAPEEGSGWKPVEPEALPAAPIMSVASQIEENDRPKRKARKQSPEIKETGVRPRALSERVCPICGEEWGSEGLARNPEPAGPRYIHARCKDERDRGGAASGVTPSPTEPAPVTPSSSFTPMTHNQHRKVMALTAEAFPGVEHEPHDHLDDRRREQVIGIMRHLGWAVSSRTEIPKEGATLLIDTLEAIRDGAMLWDGERLIRVEEATP